MVFEKKSAAIGIGLQLDVAVPAFVLAHGMIDCFDFEGASVEFDWDLSAGVKLGKYIKAARKISKVIERHNRLREIAEKAYKYRNTHKPGVIVIPVGGLSLGVFAGWEACETVVIDRGVANLERAKLGARTGSRGKDGKFRSDDRVAGLDPGFRDTLAKVLDELRGRGFNPRVAEGLRTVEEQRQKIRDGFSPPGTDDPNSPKASKHLKGKAADVIDRRWGWNTPGGKEHPFWKALGEIAEANDLIWGGMWSNRDVAHVEAAN